MKTFNLNRIQCGFLLVATLSLAGCGGGGGSSSATAGDGPQLSAVEADAVASVFAGPDGTDTLVPLEQPMAGGGRYLGSQAYAFDTASAWVRYADGDAMTAIFLYATGRRVW